MKKIFLLSFLAFFLVHCGRQEFYDVKVLTGLENLAPARNLMTGLTHQKLTLGSDSCAQLDLFAAFAPGNKHDQNITSTPVRMLTPWTSVPNPLTASWLATNATFPPIQFKVPAGITDFAVIGPVITPSSGQLDPDGSCERISSGGITAETLSVIGFNKIDVNGNTTVNIKTWALPAASSPSPNPNDPICSTSNDSEDGAASQICPERNFDIVLCTGTEGLASNCPGALKLEYLISDLNPAHPVHYMSMTANPYVLRYFPSIDPLYITPLFNGQPSAGAIHMSHDNLPYYRSIVSPIPGGNIMVTRTNEIGIIVTQEPGSYTFSAMWNPVRGASQYQVKYGTGNLDPVSNSGSFTACGGPTAGTTLSSTTVCNGFTGAISTDYTISVEAITGGAAQNITSRPFRLVGNWGTIPTLAGGTNTITMSFGATPPVDAEMYELYVPGTTPFYVTKSSTAVVGASAASTITFTGVPAGTYSGGFKARAYNSKSGSNTQTISVSPGTPVTVL